jgi:hypothetical protein
MVAYRGPREGHDTWQGDAYHRYWMEATAEHIGHPKHLAHELAGMNRDVLKARISAAGSLPKGINKAAMEHQAEVNREHESYHRVSKVRERLVKHPKAQAIFQRQHDLLKETHGMVSPERNLEVHAELNRLQGEFDALHREHEEAQS